MRLRGSRKLRDVAALGVTSVRLSCESCKTISTVDISTLKMPLDATLDDLASKRVPCSNCGTYSTAIIPHDLGVAFEAFSQ